MASWQEITAGIGSPVTGLFDVDMRVLHSLFGNDKKKPANPNGNGKPLGTWPPGPQKPQANPWETYAKQNEDWIKSTLGGTQLAAAQASARGPDTSPGAVAATNAGITDTAEQALKSVGGDNPALDEYFGHITGEAQKMGAPVEAALGKQEQASQKGLAGIQAALGGLEKADISNFENYPYTMLLQQLTSEIPYLLSKQGTYKLGENVPAPNWLQQVFAGFQAGEAGGGFGTGGVPAAPASSGSTPALPSLDPTSPSQGTNTYNPSTDTSANKT